MPDYVEYSALLAVGLALILLACELFTNAVEWAGRHMELSHGATGSVLAAVGTALPETMVPIIALAHGAGGKDIAVGAIAGAPFMLATLALFVSGGAYFLFRNNGRRPRAFNAEHEVVSRDLGFFAVIYGAAIAAATLLPAGVIRYAAAAVLAGAYLVYLKKTLGHEGDAGEEPEELHLSRVFHIERSSGFVAFQTVLALVMIVFGAHVFVLAVEHVSAIAGVPSMLLSLFIAPVATELPEKMNSVIWIRQGKDTLAIGNITGAMVFQASFPVAIGVAFTPWELSGPTIVSALIALGSACIFYLAVKAKKGLPPALMLLGGALYLAFVLYVLL